MILTLLLGLGGALGWALQGTWAQAPGASFSEPHSPLPASMWGAEAKDSSRDHGRRNWCPYLKTRLVTFVATCKTQKFHVHSQQPCPQGAPDCQRVKVMYHVAHKPVYQVKQKVMTSVAWRCCPGFQGPDCQLHDPTATAKPAQLRDGLQDSLADSELGELLFGKSAKSRAEPTSRSSCGLDSERKHREKGYADTDLSRAEVPHFQNDVPPVAEGPVGARPAVTKASPMEQESSGLSLEEAAPGDGFPQAHLSPAWSSLNESLHRLSQAVQNLSLEAEADRQVLRSLQERAVTRSDFQEMGGKFEAKVQENAERVGRLRRDTEDHLLAQRLALHRALSELQAQVDTKFKQLLRAQEPLGANGSLAARAARPEPESLHARLGQLQRNLSALHMAASLREEELQGALGGLQATVAQHGKEIQELYSESDETFEQISRVERQVAELQVNHTGLRELRVLLMERSLVLEEDRERLERQLLGLNATLQQLQAAHADLLRDARDCGCPQLSEGTGALGQGQPDAASLQALRDALLASAQALEAQREDEQRAQAERAQLRSQLRALGRDVAALQAAAQNSRHDARRLHSSFTALLQDALRHEAALAAFFGEEAMEDMSREAPGPLTPTHGQIVAALQSAEAGLQERTASWDVLATRVAHLEQTSGPSLNGSLDDLRGKLLATELGLAQQRRLFHGLFGNFQGLLAANASLDLGKLQAMLTRKDRRQQKPQGPQKRDRKPAGPWHAPAQGRQPGVPGAELWEAGPSLRAVGLRGCLEHRGVGSRTQAGAVPAERPTCRRQGELRRLSGGPKQCRPDPEARVGFSPEPLAISNVVSDAALQPAVLLHQPPGSPECRAPQPSPAEPLSPSSCVPGFPVAFYARFSGETRAPQTLRFNATTLNLGGGYFPELGYFRAPETGVYLFAVSVEFGPGPGAGQLVLGGHRQAPVHTAGQGAGDTAATFALAELQKGDRVWFELTSGAVMEARPPGTAFGGFLVCKT
ncbi:multimerin-2 [Ctenodactylus gundi]